MKTKKIIHLLLAFIIILSCSSAVLASEQEGRTASHDTKRIFLFPDWFQGSPHYNVNVTEGTEPGYKGIVTGLVIQEKTMNQKWVVCSGTCYVSSTYINWTFNGRSSSFSYDGMFAP